MRNERRIRLAPFHGKTAFHGTNPISAAAPVANAKPWLLDLATSNIPFNRVLLHRTLGKPLVDEVAVDSSGQPTLLAELATTLLPLGGTAFGFKGAGLAGLVTVLSAILTGAPADDEIPLRPDPGSPRRAGEIGHFCLAIDPDRFAGRL